MKKYVIEFIGTFFLLFVVALTANPIAIGAVLVALVYMGGYISGAQYNPAVTVALLINKKISPDEAVKFVTTQFLAAIVASAAYLIIRGGMFLPGPGAGVNMQSAFLIEALCTFLLVSVILHVALTDKTKGNDYYGIAIGFTLMALAFAGGPISGGAYNPAVGIGPLLLDFSNLSKHMPNILLYLTGPLTGAILASVLYKSKF